MMSNGITKCPAFMVIMNEGFDSGKGDCRTFHQCTLAKVFKLRFLNVTLKWKSVCVFVCSHVYFS